MINNVFGLPIYKSIVFPGYLDHLVPLCQSDKPRTIVSFNFDPDG